MSQPPRGQPPAEARKERRGGGGGGTSQGAAAPAAATDLSKGDVKGVRETIDAGSLVADTVHHRSTAEVEVRAIAVAPELCSTIIVNNSASPVYQRTPVVVVAASSSSIGGGGGSSGHKVPAPGLRAQPDHHPTGARRELRRQRSLDRPDAAAAVVGLGGSGLSGPPGPGQYVSTHLATSVWDVDRNGRVHLVDARSPSEDNETSAAAAGAGGNGDEILRRIGSCDAVHAAVVAAASWADELSTPCAIPKVKPAARKSASAAAPSKASRQQQRSGRSAAAGEFDMSSVEDVMKFLSGDG